ncbi:hypothetical protein [Streptomyces sp. AGS-58]|uniref:hypothetical protein n=1 Tax=unclassified Streptomyces TaxID=2593676 RepID=UPI0035A2D9AF
MDGDPRRVPPGHRGCLCRPHPAVRRGAAPLPAQPYAHTAWTGQLVALDDRGRITPGRDPLGDDPPRRGPRPRA